MSQSIRPILSLIAICILGIACVAVQPALAKETQAEPEKSEEFTVRKVGAMEFFSFQDMPANMPATLFNKNADPAVVKKYLPRNSAPATVTAFALKQGDTVILMDAGYGSAGPVLGALVPTMAKAGVTPDMVSLVLLTHMHPDHIGGLITKEGARVFPKAKVMVSAPEAAFWLGTEPTQEKKVAFELAAKVKAAYGDDFLTPFAFGDTVAPGVTALDASGHTPGHTAYLVESEGQSVLVVGDLLHAAALQFPEPSISSTYDMDPEKAAATRIKFLTMAAEKNLPMAGMHLPFPPVVLVKATGEKSFTFSPAAE